MKFILKMQGILCKIWDISTIMYKYVLKWIEGIK